MEAKTVKRPLTCTAAIRKYFGYNGGKLASFKKELDALTPADKAELGTLCCAMLGVECTDAKAIAAKA